MERRRKVELFEELRRESSMAAGRSLEWPRRSGCIGG